MAQKTEKTLNSARKLPFNYEAEQAVLGAVLLSQDASLVILNELKETDFYAHEHQIIFDAMLRLFGKNNNPIIDHITLTSELNAHNQLDAVGGMAYLARLTNVIPTATNFNYYMDIVKRDSVLRQLIDAGGKIVEDSFSAEDMDAALTNAESLVYSIGEKTERSSLEPIRASLTGVLSEFDEAFQNPGSKRGLPTGLAGLDMLTNGLQNGDVIQLAARPGVGKTSLALNIATNIALYAKKPVAIFSLEMPKIQLARRIASSVGGVSMSKVLRGELDENEQRRFRQAISALADAPIYLDDSSVNTPAEILHKCRRMKNDKNKGLSFVVIDYIGLMKAGGRNYQNDRQQEISYISRNLKIMAKELNVPVLVLSQLNRAVEGRKDHRPMLSDLRESGSIEQDADIVMFIYKSEQYRDLAESEVEEGIAELIIAKNRNGSQGTIKLRWDGETTTFSNLPEDEDRQSLESTAPPLSKHYKDAYNKAKEPVTEVNNFDDSVFDAPTEPPNEVPFPVDDEYDEIFDNPNQPETIAETLKEDK